MSKAKTTSKQKRPTAGLGKSTGGAASASQRQAAQRGQIRGRFDSAQTNLENSRHWGLADGLSADAAASAGVRRLLRNRARYETANNTYARGIVNTLANDCVGTGPRLQLNGLPRIDAQIIEKQFQAWCEAVELPEKLRTMRCARAVDGEAFALLVSNPELETQVKLDVRLIEAEQVASRWGEALAPNHIDGIKFDNYGNPATYEILPEHPGGFALTTLEPVPTPASQVLHFYVVERPGQRRGVPEMTAALPLFAQLRRWTLSVLAAAETASDFAALMFSEAPPDDDEPVEPFDRVDIERRAMMTVPQGWKVSQLKAEQPTSTYSDVKREILNEIARCFDMPFNIAAGNSAGYNYSSGRLDHQTYFKQVRVNRSRMIAQVLERLFVAWRKEAILIEGFLPQSARKIDTNWTHRWFFDGFEHVDPAKEANAQKQRLDNLTTTLAEECAKEGKDWEEVLDQAAVEAKKLRALGLVREESSGSAPARADDEDADPLDDADEEAAAPAQSNGNRGAAVSGEVQSTALNGAQVTALQQILEQVAAGSLDASAAEQLILLSFPLFSATRVRLMVQNATKSKRPPAPVESSNAA